MSFCPSIAEEIFLKIEWNHNNIDQKHLRINIKNVTNKPSRGDAKRGRKHFRREYTR